MLIALASRAWLPGKIPGLTSPAVAITLYIFLTNALSYIIPFPYIFYVAYLISFIIFLCAKGLGSAVVSEKIKIHYSSLLSLPVLFIMAILLIFTNAYHDAGCHYPIINSIGRGNLPVQLINDPAMRLDYHYGFDLWAAAIKYFSGCNVELAADLASLTLFLATLLIVFNLAQTFFQGEPLWVNGSVLLFVLGFGMAYLHPLALQWGTFKLAYPFGSTLLLSSSKIGSSYSVLSFVNHPYIFFLLRRPVGLAYMLFALLWLMFFELCQGKKPPTPFYLWLMAALALSPLAAEEEFIFCWLTLLAIYIYFYQWGKFSNNRLLVILPATLLIALIQGGVLTSLIFTPSNYFRSSLISDITFKWPPGFSPHGVNYQLLSPQGISFLLFEFSPVFFIFAWLLFFRRGIFYYLIYANYAIAFLIPIFFRFAFSAHDLDRLTFLSSAIANLFGLSVLQDILKNSSLNLKRLLVSILLCLSLSASVVRIYMYWQFLSPPNAMLAYDQILEHNLKPYLPDKAVILADADLAQFLGRVGYFSIYPATKQSGYFKIDRLKHEAFIKNLTPETLKKYRIQYAVFQKSSPLIAIRDYPGTKFIAAIVLPPPDNTRWSNNIWLIYKTEIQMDVDR